MISDSRAIARTVKTKLNEDLFSGLQRRETRRVVLLFSGGTDSTAAGILLQGQGYDIHPLFIDYGQAAAEAERSAVLDICPRLGFQTGTVLSTDVLRQMSNSRLLADGAADDREAWVPGRNTLFMVLAAIHSARVDADGICLGYTLEDNFVFGDNDYFHHKAAELLLSRSLLRPVTVFLPTLGMNKRAVIECLMSKHVLDLTVSCWNANFTDGRIVVCHSCANCVERDRCLTELGMA